MKIVQVSLWTNIAVLIVLFLIGGLLLLLTLPPGGPQGVAAVTTRGDRIMAIRAVGIRPQEEAKQVVVFGDAHARTQYLVVAEPVHARTAAPYHEYRLSQSEWATINTIRQQWCVNPPRSVEQDDPRGQYAVGFRCTEGSVQSYRQLHLEATALPPELNNLIMLTQERLP